MINKKDIFSIIKIAITLCLITAISALILAVVNEFTAPVIANNNLKKQNDAMMVVLPDAVDFKQVDGDFNELVSQLFVGFDAQGNEVGYVAMATPGGYGGEISLAVGIDNEIKVTGIDVISHSETAGLGAKCDTPEFKGEFVGKTQGIVVSKSNAKDNEIDAITSATVTSKAVTSGVNAALDAVALVKGDKVNE